MDDIPSPTNCLHGAYICSTKPLARVKSIRMNPEMQLDGVSSIISRQDIPESGENIGSMTIFDTEPLFADGITRCAGERLAVVVSP